MAIAGLSERVEHVLTILGMLAPLPVHPNVESAINAVAAESFAS